MKGAARLLAAVLACGGAARSGIVEGSLADLPAAGFELGLAGWTQTASDGGQPFVLSPGAGGGGWAASANLAHGVDARLALQTPALFPVGTKLEARGRVHLDASVGAGDVALELEAYAGGAWVVLARSAPLATATAPRGRWLPLVTQPFGATDARVPAGTSALRLAFRASAPGLTTFDAAALGRHEYAQALLRDASFEGAGAWTGDGPLSLAGGASVPDGYYGLAHLELAPGGATRAWQTLRCNAPEGDALAAGRELEAGAWLRADAGQWLPLAPSDAARCELRVLAADATGAETLLALGTWRPVLGEAGAWRYLETTPLAPLAARHVRVRVEVAATLAGVASADFVQLGERWSVDGNPPRRVGANYVGRYASPLFPGADPTPVDAQDRWRNWRWTAPPACDGGYLGFAHDPDCATSGACLRPNGRRDLAISTSAGGDLLPLVGAYDSRDPAVIAYHVDLARAAGLDHFVYDWQGHVLAQQSVAQGRDPLNEQAFQALMDVAEADGRDFKVAVMYEPKVHLLGWVAGEPALADKLAGIVQDLTWLVQHQRGRRAALRREGRLVVFVFRDASCTPDGTQCLDAGTWAQVAQAVTAATGEALCLVGDLVPGPGSPMEGVARWRLVDRPFLVHRTFADARSGAPTAPAPSLASLEQHARDVHAVGAAWAAQDDARRVHVALVWPGFDDSGVAGWGAPNLVGEDGQPLCVRVADDFAGAFYPTTVASALDSGASWVQVCTWNDWNEDTQLEPAWLAGAADGLRGAAALPAGMRAHVFGRLLATQQWVADFKGVALDPRDIAVVARDYLASAAGAGGVAYD